MEDKVVGYLVNGEVLCKICAFCCYDIKSTDGNVNNSKLVKVYLSNIKPYSQSCHGCGVVLVESPCCELFEKGT